MQANPIYDVLSSGEALPEPRAVSERSPSDAAHGGSGMTCTLWNDVYSMDALFGLEPGRLNPILEAATGSAVAEFLGFSRQEVDGKADTLLCDFTYRTPDGLTGQTKLFVKQCVWGGIAESPHYRHLASHGVPSPRLYGSLRGVDGLEIIFVEPLTATGFHRNDEAEWRCLLSLLARFNACPVTADYAPHLREFDQIGQAGGGVWISALPAFPADAEIAASLRAAGAGDELPALLGAARDLFTQVEAQPRGLLHQDLSPDNVGWLGGRAEMVVFDLHKNACGPRFADVAPYLAVPDWSNDAAFLDGSEGGTRSRRETLIEHYLDEYARAGGSLVLPEVFQAEASALAWAHRVSVISWLVQAGAPERVEGVLEYLRGHGAGS